MWFFWQLHLILCVLYVFSPHWGKCKLFTGPCELQEFFWPIACSGTFFPFSHSFTSCKHTFVLIQGLQCISLKTHTIVSFGNHFPLLVCSADFGCLGLPQFSSVAQSCPTLCNPMNHSTPGLPVHHLLPESTQTHAHRVGDAIQPSHLLSSPIPPAPNPSQHQGFSSESTLRMRWPKYWSFSFSTSPSNEHPGLMSFRMDWLDLLAVQGTLKSLLQHHSSKASVLQWSAFFTIQLSHPYITTGKTIALTRQTFVGKVMSLLFNMLSRLVISFLPRSKRLPRPWYLTLVCCKSCCSLLDFPSLYNRLEAAFSEKLVQSRAKFLSLLIDHNLVLSVV